MTEYLVYATGSAQPIENATLSFLVTTSPQPLINYLMIGFWSGITVTLLITVLIKAIERKYE